MKTKIKKCRNIKILYIKRNYWYLYDASRHKRNHKQMDEEVIKIFEFQCTKVVYKGWRGGGGGGGIGRV